MYKYITFSLLLLLSGSLSAQSFFGGLKLKKVAVSFGTDQDRLQNLNHEYLLNTLREDTEVNFSDIPFESEDLYSMTCENPNIRAEFAMHHPALRNTEIRFAGSAMIGRIDAVKYKTGNYGDDNYQTLSFQSWTNEVAAEASFVKNGNLGPLNFYGGAGTNLGYSFGGNVNVEGDYICVDSNGNVTDRRDIQEEGTVVHKNYSENIDAKNGLHQRAFLMAGAGITFFKRVELGLEGRRGVGYRAIAGAGVQGTQLHSFGLTAKWVLK